MGLKVSKESRSHWTIYLTLPCKHGKPISIIMIHADGINIRNNCEYFKLLCFCIILYAMHIYRPLLPMTVLIATTLYYSSGSECMMKEQGKGEKKHKI